MKCYTTAFSLVEPCTLSPPRRKFVECGLDSNFVSSGFPRLALFFARHVLKKELFITRGDDVQHTAIRLSNQWKNWAFNV